MSRVAIIQPSYIPWKGFFHIISKVDVFVHFDDVQYTVRDWRSRNQIKLPSGDKLWLTIPVKGGRNQRLCDVQVDDSQNWRRKHLASLRHSYGKQPYFSRYFPQVEELFGLGHTRLCDFTIALTEHLAALLGLAPRFVRASELGGEGHKTERLIDLVQRVGGTSYLSGPAAAVYIQPELFAAAEIELEYQSYDGYPIYPQLGGTFDHYVSVLDLLFAVGPDAPAYIWGKA